MSAVVQEKQVETIFDYDLTDEEKSKLLFGQSKEEYLSTHSMDEINKGLMFLFAMRGNKKLKDFYKSKLNKDWVKTHLNYDQVV